MRDQELNPRAEMAACERLLEFVLPPGDPAEVRGRFRHLLQSGALAERRLTVTSSNPVREEVMPVREVMEKLTLEEHEKLVGTSDTD